MTKIASSSGGRARKANAPIATYPPLAHERTKRKISPASSDVDELEPELESKPPHKKPHTHVAMFLSDSDDDKATISRARRGVDRSKQYSTKGTKEKAHHEMDVISDNEKDDFVLIGENKNQRHKLPKTHPRAPLPVKTEPDVIRPPKLGSRAHLIEVLLRHSSAVVPGGSITPAMKVIERKAASAYLFSLCE